MATSTPTIAVNPDITPEQLHAFYVDNAICEAELDPQVAGRVLEHSSLVVAAFEDGAIAAIGRASFDGMTASIMELSVALRHQGEGGRYGNGSLVEADPGGVGTRVGQRLLQELRAMGALFFEASIVSGCEEPFCEGLGFSLNSGQVPYFIDERPYARSS